MDLHATEVSPPSIGTTPPRLDAYVVGGRRERYPNADLYDAVHCATGTPYRLYVLRPHAMANGALLHQIACEADAARWLQHPAVPKLDVLGTTPGRRHYLAAEHRPGPSLRTLVADSGWLPAEYVVRLAAPLVEVLDEAHALGLVHGRLTPDVVHVTEAPAYGGTGVTLTGLGLAAVTRGVEVTSDERPFISPAQAAGGSPTASDDVYGLASLLDYALHGEVCATECVAENAGPRKTVSCVLRAARSPNPADRPPSVRVFWEELLSALVAGDSTADAPRRSHTGTRVRAPMPPTRYRRRVPRAYIWWLAVPMLAALGALARGTAGATHRGPTRGGELGHGLRQLAGTR
ncbi:hypothetical protein tb265_42040 [Gemmatimonadetes bacterium T265]|nr:hypothetical protein tb265_42040 [Gemmatimonadetes bacterium T265]